MADRDGDRDEDLPDDRWAGDEDAGALDDDLHASEREPWLDARSVIVLRAKQPLEDWVRQLEDRGPEWTFSELDRCQAVLVPELARMVDVEEWLRQNHEELFERQLRDWEEDPSRWPADRSLERLHEWFDVIFAPTVDDMTGRPLAREVTCPPLSLRRMREEFMQLPSTGSLWVDIESGEVMAWTDDELEAIRDGTTEALDISAEDLDALQRAFESGTLVEIVHRREVRDRSLMLEFARLVEPAAVSRRLVVLVNGKKGGRRFGEAIDAAGLRDRWSEWFEDRIEDELSNALDDRGVPYVDDVYEEEDGEDQR